MDGRGRWLDNVFVARLWRSLKYESKMADDEAAAQLLGLERRQVFRLLKAYRTAGPAGLISKRRGRPGNRRKPV